MDPASPNVLHGGKRPMHTLMPVIACGRVPSQPSAAAWGRRSARRSTDVADTTIRFGDGDSRGPPSAPVARRWMGTGRTPSVASRSFVGWQATGWSFLRSLRTMFERSWLTSRYFPSIGAWDVAHFPPIDVICTKLGGTAAIRHVPIPSDCQDGFLGAFWRRPAAFLTPVSRRGSRRSCSSARKSGAVANACSAKNLENGEWHRRFGHLLELDAFDVGYRLVTAQL